MIATALDLPFKDRERIVKALAEQAIAYPFGPVAYYRDLVDRTDLPLAWKMTIAGMWSGDALADARKLVVWALGRDVNPKDQRYTTLGSFLNSLLENQGLEQRSATVALIFIHRLYRDERLLQGLASRYQIPLEPAAFDVGAALAPSPDVELRVPLEDVELQGLLAREPEFLDVGFLARAIERAASICRVDTADGRVLGTGFLISRQMVMTNYHVVQLASGVNLHEKASNLLFRFGVIGSSEGNEFEGQVYGCKPEGGIVRFSPVEHLDYALVQVDQRINDVEDLRPITYVDHKLPRKGMGLNILGHPYGGPMKLAVSGNGVAGVYEDVGLIQYVTRAVNGSSGSPCFNDEWQLVALHHAERAKYFGAVREGILLGRIYDEVADLV